MSFNKKLKFSWGHIIALVALIFISYTTFMGVTYYTDGNFVIAGISVAVVDMLLLIFFIGAQMMKGADEKFRRKIVIERILVLSAPIVFIITMLPFAHFWTVFENRKDVETTFSESLTATKGIFDSYEEYAVARINNYDAHLRSAGSSTIRRENSVEALRLQIMDKNYFSLKESAVKWIDKSSKATVWNVFVIGNIKKIESSIETWENSLNDFSGKFMSNEADSLSAFSLAVPSVKEAKNNLSNLRGVYQTWEMPNLIAIATALLMYFLLMFPYIIQKRSTRSTFKLFKQEKGQTLEDLQKTPNRGNKYQKISL